MIIVTKHSSTVLVRVGDRCGYRRYRRRTVRLDLAKSTGSLIRACAGALHARALENAYGQSFLNFCKSWDEIADDKRVCVCAGVEFGRSKLRRQAVKAKFCK